MKAVIKVIGKQATDYDSDRIEIDTLGSVEETDSDFIIKYDEVLDDIENPVSVMVKVDKAGKMAEMIRSGYCNSVLFIERSARNLCCYKTEYGNILLGVAGRSIKHNYDPLCNKGIFYIKYDLDINGAFVSYNTVILEYKYTGDDN